MTFKHFPLILYQNTVPHTVSMSLFLDIYDSVFGSTKLYFLWIGSGDKT